MKKTIGTADVDAYVAGLEKAMEIIKSVPLMQRKINLKNKMLAAILTGAYKKNLSQTDIKKIMFEVKKEDGKHK